MKKLTKEQADWVLEKLYEYRGNDGIDPEDARLVINECTESSVVELPTQNGDTIKVTLNREQT
jgi:hypothetical protein